VSKAFAVGMVIARKPETLRSDPFFPAFIAGLESVLSEQGYALLLQVTPGHEREQESYRRLAEEGRVDGVFITDLYVDDPRPGLLAELGLPAVIVGPGLDGGVWPAVGMDDAPPVVAAVEHLIDLGHTRIAHVGGPSELVHSRSRRAAWARALTAAGLPESPWIEADFSAEGGAVATRRLLDHPEPPSAIVYANDLMALAGMSEALSRGIELPGGLSIVGYDDTELSAVVRPALTTVRSDVLEWARAAAIRLLALILGQPAVAIDLPAPELVIRESTGPPHPPQAAQRREL
jgi:DNA-binding LacI/PurR family transcriptional regulator